MLSFLLTATNASAYINMQNLQLVLVEENRGPEE